METNWKDILDQSIRDVEELRKNLALTEDEAQQMGRIIQRYPL